MTIVLLLVGLGLIVLGADWLVDGAFQGNADIAVGNVMGSNMFNILLILGASALVTPLSFASVTLVDASVLLLSALLLLLWAYTGRRLRLDRWEGCVMLALFAAYYVYLFYKL